MKRNKNWWPPPNVWPTRVENNENNNNRQQRASSFTFVMLGSPKKRKRINRSHKRKETLQRKEQQQGIADSLGGEDQRNTLRAPSLSVGARVQYIWLEYLVTSVVVDACQVSIMILVGKDDTKDPHPSYICRKEEFKIFEWFLLTNY